jgi:hypothetical protein
MWKFFSTGPTGCRHRNDGLEKVKAASKGPILGRPFRVFPGFAGVSGGGRRKVSAKFPLLSASFPPRKRTGKSVPRGARRRLNQSID